MASIILNHNDFNSTKNGLSIVAVILSLLFLLANILIGFVVLTLTVTLIFFKVGIEIDTDKKRFRRFKSYFGNKSGDWNDLTKYKAQIILKKNLKGEIISPKLVNSIGYKNIVYEVNLTNDSHRLRLPLKKFKKLESAKGFATMIDESLNIPLEKYTPLISDKTRLRRANRRKSLTNKLPPH